MAQLYLTNKGDKRGPIKTLIGFQRVLVPARESVWVHIPVEEEFFQTFVEDKQHFEYHSGEFVFHYGDQEVVVRR